MLFPELILWQYVSGRIRARVEAIREDERGVTLEMVVLWGVLAAAAIAVGVILLNRTSDKANSIPLE